MALIKDMNMNDIEPIVLAHDYWIGVSKENKNKDVCSKKENVNNVTALIISALNQYFPELKYSPETKFIGFQNELSKILTKILSEKNK